MIGRAVATALCCGALVSACASWSSDASRRTAEALRFDAPTTTAATAPTVAPACDPEVSFAPPASVPEPGQMPAGSTMARIAERGYLEAGVDDNTLLLAYRNPLSGALEGFEVDLLREVPRALLGDADAVRFKTVNTRQKTELVAAGSVDITASAISMICSRWQSVSFTAGYYRAAQRIMVRDDSPIERVDQLAGQPVCITSGSSSRAELAQVAPDAVPYEVETRTECLAELQAGDVPALFTHDTFLFGFRAQDPTTRILTDVASPTTYGMAVAKGHEDLAAFVNAVLERLHDDGTMDDLYRRNFLTCARHCPVEGAPTTVDWPEPRYGRTP